MTHMNPKLMEIVQKDGRYAYEAFEFVFQALQHTQEMLGRLPGTEASPEPRNHVTGPQLLEGIRSLALREFGLMARVVFKLWGIQKTDDFGEIVFRLVESDLMSKTDEDSRDDFRDVFDLDQALVQDFRIQLDEAR